MPIYITHLGGVPHHAGLPIDNIVSIGHVEDLPNIAPFRERRLNLHRFSFVDVSSQHPDHANPPSYTVMRDLFKTFDQIVENGGQHILFHCAAGISRSPAAAFLFLVHGKGLSYEDAYQEILRVRGHVQPNMLMIKLADDLMGRGGEMVRFVQAASGRSADTFDWLMREEMPSPAA